MIRNLFLLSFSAQCESDQAVVSIAEAETPGDENVQDILNIIKVT